MDLPPHIKAALIRPPVYAEPHTDNPNPRPKPQQTVCHEPLAAHQAETPNASGGGRIQVSVVSYRRRLLDEDNLCPKYFVDALRYENLLPSDAPQFVTIQTSQVKVDDARSERTVVTLNYEGQ